MDDFVKCVETRYCGGTCVGYDTNGVLAEFPCTKLQKRKNINFQNESQVKLVLLCGSFVKCCSANLVHRNQGSKSIIKINNNTIFHYVCFNWNFNNHFGC